MKLGNLSIGSWKASSWRLRSSQLKIAKLPVEDWKAYSWRLKSFHLNPVVDWKASNWSLKSFQQKLVKHPTEAWKASNWSLRSLLKFKYFQLKLDMLPTKDLKLNSKRCKAVKNIIIGIQTNCIVSLSLKADHNPITNYCYSQHQNLSTKNPPISSNLSSASFRHSCRWLSLQAKPFN